MPAFFILFDKHRCMSDKLEEVKRNLQDETKTIITRKDAEQLKIKYLGRKGIVNDLMKLIPALPTEKRAAFGQQVNFLKIEITD